MLLVNPVHDVLLACGLSDETRLLSKESDSPTDEYDLFVKSAIKEESIVS